MTQANVQQTAIAKPEPKALSMEDGAFVFKGEGWQEYEMTGVIEQAARFYACQEKTRQDSIVTQKLIEALTVVGCFAVLVWGIALIAKQFAPPAYQNHQSVISAQLFHS